MAAPDFWNDQEQAREVVDQLKSLKAIVEPLEELCRSGEDLETLLEMAHEDSSISGEVASELERLETLLDGLGTEGPARWPARCLWCDHDHSCPRRRDGRERLG